MQQQAPSFFRRLRPQHRFFTAGFTLIEVLVALSIVAIALIAGAQATAALTFNAQRQTDTTLAHLCAENELIKIRLSNRLPTVGSDTISCPQAGRIFDVKVSVQTTPNPSFRRVDAQVLEDNLSILRLSTVVGRY